MPTSKSPPERLLPRDLRCRWFRRGAPLVAVAAGLFLGMCPAFADDSPADPRRPNVVFIFADDK